MYQVLIPIRTAALRARLLGLSLSFLLLLVTLLLSGTASAAGVLDVAWSAPTTNADGTPLTDLGKYRLYVGTTPRNATSPPCNSQVIDVGNVTSYHVTGLTQGTTYYLQITALDTAGNESACSGQASGAARAETANLYVTKPGTGSGTVASSPAGINCGSTCNASYPLNTSVTLTATPASGSTFAGWSGPCSGTNACTVVMSQMQTVNATFNAVATQAATLTVTKAGTGTGSVTSSPAGVNCGTSCSASYSTTTSVTLTATPASGSVFAGWSGACTGMGACTVFMTQMRTVTATFNTATVQTAAATLTVTKVGPGTGTVTSSPGGVNCGATCSANYALNSSVTLTAAPTTGSRFTGWSGACSGTGACTIRMSQSSTVTARFKRGGGR